MCCMLDASIHFLRIMEYVRLQEVWRYSYPLKVQPLRAHAWDLPTYRCAAHACCHSLTMCMLPRLVVNIHMCCCSYVVASVVHVINAVAL